MNTAPKQNFMISARHLGPIFSLDGELTKHAQNLIFARNGTGKSFLSRAFRYLDLKNQGRDIIDAAQNLISDESTDGKGAFSFRRGANEMGVLHLERGVGNVSANVTDTIFHVFSEDFVQEELRERAYEIDGEIENQISVDSENIKLKDAQDALARAVVEEQAATSTLQELYERGKISELNEKAGINKQLKEFRALSFEGLLARFSEMPASPEKSFAEILKDLDSLKSIPAEPAYPEILELLKSDEIDMHLLATSLQRVTSPSSVSGDIKKKIEDHHGFYEAGSKIVRDEHRRTCPFCEQGITSAGPKEIIDAYISYFEDEEEKHKAELREFFRRFNQKEGELKEVEAQIVRQKSKYDALKRFLPSRKETEVDDGGSQIADARAAIASIKTVIQGKASALSAPYAMPSVGFSDCIGEINKVIAGNNGKVAELNKAIEKSDDERKSLQRRGCEVFDCEFAIGNWAKIEALRTLRAAVGIMKSELDALEKASPSTNARIRVAETFQLLLKSFFAEKYIFDIDKFALKRGDREMARGPHRTLSDGEKAAIAFCYFIACIHRKVKSNGDYKKLFLVFDDPVTSMSYDFVFSIAQTLKNLGISNTGEISINPGKIDGSKCARPELLILTHSSYFFNISRTNRVVKEDATFSLISEGAVHKLAHLESYVTPYEQQLTHVYYVANGKDPDHSTGNAIRSVLEAVGRFCRPDRSQSLENFLVFLAGDQNLSIKSVLINSLCHGTYYEETPPPDDLKLACQETIAVVERFAEGQILLIKGAVRG